MILSLISAIILGLVALWVLWVAEQPATPPLSAARDNEPTPDEPGDHARLSNPASRRGSGLTLAQIVAKAQEDAESVEYVIPSVEFVPEEPDEPVEDELEPVEEEPVVVPAAVVEAPPAPTPTEPEVIPPFVIQGEPTQRAALYGVLADSYPVYDDSWVHSGMTGFLPWITDEPLEVQQARHDAAALLDEVTAA